MADEREKFRAAVRTMFEREREEHLFQIFLANMGDFMRLLSGVTDGLRRNKISRGDLAGIQREADRRVLNVLTSMRTFLDHWETKLKRRYGKESPEVEQFKAACAHEYDTRFGYRFAYKLRNFAQHCGLPVGAIRLVSRSRVYLLDPLGGPSRRMLAPSRERDEAVLLFRRKELLTQFDGWGVVHRELEARRADISVAPQLKAAGYGIRRVHHLVRSVTARTARPHARFLRDLMQRVRDDDVRRVPVVFTATRKSRGEVQLRLHHFPVEQMAQLLPGDEYLRLLT